MKIGYTGNNYPERRNIIDVVEEVSYVNVSKFNKYAYFNKINFWLNQRGFKSFFDTDYYQFDALRSPRVNGLHFFNSVNFGNEPWMCTFETVLPYFNSIKGNFKSDQAWEQITKDPHVLKAMEAMASHHCKALFALSKSTKHIQEQLLMHFPVFRDKIMHKLHVLHPPQIALPYRPRSWSGTFQLVFVGRAFYRKGGQELIHALTKIQKEIPIHLTVVSSLDLESGWPGVDEAQRQEDLRWLKDQTWITHFDQLPNVQVLQLFEESHLGFLPTWQDTYGYSVLEMQSRGCPVLTTDIRSLPEINPDQVGWRLSHPVNHWHEWTSVPHKREDDGSQFLSNSIYEKTLEILQNPQGMEAKGRAAVHRIEKEHHPAAHAEILIDYYQQMFPKK
jgi:glycosyltransferase involved in cell wall biosynthesis